MRFPFESHLARRTFLQAVAAAGATRWLSAQTTPAVKPAWQDGKPLPLAGVSVTLSKPQLVARNRGYLWFPTLVHLVNGDFLAVMSNYADEHTKTSTALVAWSHDGGFSWTKPIEAQYGDVSLRRAGDDELLLPYYLRPQADGSLISSLQLCPKRKQELRLLKDAVTVVGLPRKDKSLSPDLGVAGFVFNGQSLKLKNGNFLATMYGTFEGADRYSLITVESQDGARWIYRSTVADEKCKLPGKEGPCESALCRLADGGLMCVFRVESGMVYGQSYSEDEGKTWSEPKTMKGPLSVQPSLAVMKEGTLALTGGRPGIFLWLSTDRTGSDWQAIDLQAHHNQLVPEEPIREANQTSAYTEIVPLDEEQALIIYDRVPNGWKPIEDGSNETNSVWVVRAKIELKKAVAA